MSGMRDKLEAALDKAAEQRGFELVDVEVAGSSGRPIVRVYLDKEGSIDLDAVAEANAWVSEVADEEVAGAYTLEVSSPGIERPLRKRTDFERFTGERVSVKTDEPVSERRNFSGELKGLDGEDLLLEEEGTTYRIPLRSVAKARLKPEITF